MPRQKPPKSAGELTGFPYKDFWEEFGDPGGRLYADGLQREMIDRSFTEAEKRGATHLSLTKMEVWTLTRPLDLPPEPHWELTEQLFYLAGHYLSPRFHKLFGDSPVEVRRRMQRIASTATKLGQLMADLTPAVQRYVAGARWWLGNRRRADPEIDWSTLEALVADLASSAATVAHEFPKPLRGTSMNVLQGRWLRQSAEAIEKATGHRIETKVSQSSAEQYRLEGTEGAVFRAYCTRIDKGLMPRTLVTAVRAYHRHGLGGQSS